VLELNPPRTNEFAAAVTGTTAKQVPVQGYGKPSVALPWKEGRFSGQDFALRPDGILRCPADKMLRSTEHRREADGSLRVLYSARIRDCAPAQSVRSVSGMGKPPQSRAGEVASCILFGLGSRLCGYAGLEPERTPMCLYATGATPTDRGKFSAPATASPFKAEVILSRSQRAHSHLSWEERFVRNARLPTASQVTIRLFGVPEGFATWLGLATA
jgi:hypothetical protein